MDWLRLSLSLLRWIQIFSIVIANTSSNVRSYIISKMAVVIISVAMVVKEPMGIK